MPLEKQPAANDAELAHKAKASENRKDAVATESIDHGLTLSSLPHAVVEEYELATQASAGSSVVGSGDNVGLVEDAMGEDKLAPFEEDEGSSGDSAEYDVQDEVLNTFIEALCDCGAEGSQDTVAVGIKRVYSAFVSARVAHGDVRASSLAEGKVILKGFIEAKKAVS